MAHTTFIRSWPAIGLGAFFGGVTGFVLFEDVLHGASINTGHVQTLAALVGAIAAGHMAWPAIKSRETIIQGLMLAVLSVGALAYVCVTSGARNAETSGNKAATITAANAARSREEGQLARAAGMLAEAQNTLDAKCVKGKANKGTCDGIRTTINVYTAAIKGHSAELAKLPAPKVNGYAHAAKVLASWGVAVTDEWLSLNMPFLVVLISELGCVAFLHLGLGHKAKPKPVEPEFNDSDLAPLPVETDNVLSFCRAFKAANGRRPTIREVQSKFPECPRTTAHRRSWAA
jgi:hypothetical protein